MSADEPIEISFLKDQEREPEPSPEIIENDDSLSWLAAAFDDDEPLPGASPRLDEVASVPDPDIDETLDLADMANDIRPGLTVVPDLPETPDLLTADDLMSSGPQIPQADAARDLLDSNDHDSIPALPDLGVALSDPALLDLDPATAELSELTDDLDADTPELSLEDLASLASDPGLEEGDDEREEHTHAEPISTGLPSQSMEAIHNRKGFREELLAAFSQIYGR